MSNVPDINVILAQMAEMQKQLNDLQSLKKDVKEIKEISSIGEDVAKEVAEEVNQLKENGVIIPHLEKQAESVLFPKRKEKNGIARILLESEIKEARANSRSARECSKKLGVSYTTYKKYAKMYGVHVVCDPSSKKNKRFK
jgi:tRNA(Glu) U13 pseudouridine synthase TruD